MDMLIQWVQSWLQAGLPAATFATIIGLGLVVATVVGLVRTVWRTKSDTALFVLVSVLSVLLVTVVFVQDGLSIKTHILYWLVASALVAASAVFQHQAVKKVIKPAFAALSRKE